MSNIDKPKDGYDPTPYWVARTDRVLAGDHVLQARDIDHVHPDVLAWLEGQFVELAVKLGRKLDVVEIGCGFGRWATALAPHCRSFTGIDVVPKRIAYAAEHHPGTFHCFDPSGPWPVEVPADVFMSVTVLQHLPLRPTLGILRECAARVRPGGTLLLAEWRFEEASREELDRRYAEPSTESHMIPKPLAELKTATPGMVWTGECGCFVVRAP